MVTSLIYTKSKGSGRKRAERKVRQGFVRMSGESKTTRYVRASSSTVVSTAEKVPQKTPHTGKPDHRREMKKQKGAIGCHLESV